MGSIGGADVFFFLIFVGFLVDGVGKGEGLEKEKQKQKQKEGTGLRTDVPWAGAPFIGECWSAGWVSATIAGWVATGWWVAQSISTAQVQL